MSLKKFTKSTTNNLTNFPSFYPKLLTWTVAHLRSTQTTSLGTSFSTWKDSSLPLNCKNTQVSFPGIDATVIVDVKLLF